jgi:hypothetical protein
VPLPGVRSATELGDAMNRVAWYLGGTWQHEPPRVTFYLDRAAPDVALPPADQRAFLGALRGADVALYDDDAALEEDGVVLWRARDLLRPALLERLSRLYLLDPHLFSTMDTAGALRLARGCQWDSDAQHVGELTRRNLAALIERTEGRREALVLGTGPSLGELDVRAAAGRVVIGCNSLVRNATLLESLRPDAICFADPVFHLGPSEYAAQFRDDLLAAIERYDCFAVTRADAAAVLLRHHPRLEHRLVGFELGSTWRIPTLEQATVHVTGNVLTLLMVPLAAALAEEVWIAGCDGRQHQENYFWRHHAATQYGDLMASAFRTHPSFFRDRHYADYYREHSAQLAEQLSCFEDLGKRFWCATPSYIPALSARARLPAAPSGIR